MDKNGFKEFYEEKSYYPQKLIEDMVMCLASFEKAIDTNLDDYCDDPFEILNKYRIAEEEDNSDLQFSIHAYIVYLQKGQAFQNYTNSSKDSIDSKNKQE